jgi:transposase InsO family protein
MSKDNLVKRLSEFHSDNGSEYINNELKDFFLMSRVIHELILPYSLESNGIAECFNQIINIIAYSMTIATPDFPTCG